MEIKLTNDNFKETVMNSEKPVLIDFWAAWCGPCRMIAPIIEEIAEERKDILVCKVNVDEEEALAAQFGISSIPTIVVMKNGKITAKAAGYRPKPELRRGGYCPCVVEKNENTKCMCKEFREQIQDPDFEGYCHCMLYYKEK